MVIDDSLFKKIHQEGGKHLLEQSSPTCIADSRTLDMYKLKFVHNKVFITERCVNKHLISLKARFSFNLQSIRLFV